MYTLPNLPDSTAREVYARLRNTLQMLPTDTPEARDADAMRAVAALHPTDAMEARVAADIVGLEAYGNDCLRLAGVHCTDLAATMQCRAQATSMFRQMRCLLRDYQRTQAERDKALLAMHPAAMERAGYWFYSRLRDFSRLSGYNRLVPGFVLGRRYGDPQQVTGP
jgi:hypothetical protein